MQLIDTHSHIYAEEFDTDRREALSRARDRGITRLLLPAIDSESHERMLSLAQEEPELCRPMMGLHPTSVNENPRWREELALVEQYLAKHKSGHTYSVVCQMPRTYACGDVYGFLAEKYKTERAGYRHCAYKGA
jgi:TatD DNase family protein